MKYPAETKALIWHETALFKDSVDFGLCAALVTFRDHGLPMAVVTHGDPDQVRGNMLRQGLFGYFSKNASKVAIFTSADHETGGFGHALTGAFAQALKMLGTDHRMTIALVDNCEQTRCARDAGLPVITYSNAERAVRDRTVDYGACITVSAPIDLESAVLQFRPFQEAKWYPVAAPGSSR